MKTRNFALIVSIIMMGAVIGASGQAGHGNNRGYTGNQNKESKKEVKSEKKNNFRENGSYKLNDRNNQRVNTPQNSRYSEMRVNREINSKKYNGNNGNYSKNGKGYDDNRDYAGNNDNYRREMDRKGNYYNNNDRQNRNYNYSSYYRKNFVPEYFRGNKHYMFHPKYGHTVMRFGHDPLMFYSNMGRYYFDNGFFYRYYSGVGYVWIEDPYNIWFNELPYGAVRVRINGHNYFRIGNAFFASGPRGYRLISLPDHYYRYGGPSISISARF